ncbi:Opsin, blue-sensitive [Varanus komodoensis]|nr:Opsin, blue-sensitive [Varanus komodoensis]
MQSKITFALFATTPHCWITIIVIYNNSKILLTSSIAEPSILHLAISCLTQFCVICRSDHCSLHFPIQIINENVEEHWAQDLNLTCYLTLV